MIMMLVHINQCYKLKCVQSKTWPGTTQPRYTYTKNNHWGPSKPTVAFGHPPQPLPSAEWQWNRPWRCLSLGSYLSDARRHAWKTSILRWARYNRYPSLNNKAGWKNFTHSFSSIRNASFQNIRWLVRIWFGFKGAFQVGCGCYPLEWRDLNLKSRVMKASYG